MQSHLHSTPRLQHVHILGPTVGRFQYNITRWRFYQGGTSGEERLFAVLAGEADSFFLFGRTGGVLEDFSVGRTDLAVIKLDENGTELWRWQVIAGNYF